MYTSPLYQFCRLWYAAAAPRVYRQLSCTFIMADKKNLYSQRYHWMRGTNLPDINKRFFENRIYILIRRFFCSDVNARIYVRCARSCKGTETAPGPIGNKNMWPSEGNKKFLVARKFRSCVVFQILLFAIMCLNVKIYISGRLYENAIFHGNLYYYY